MDLAAQLSIFTCNHGIESRYSCPWRGDRCNDSNTDTQKGKCE